MPSAIGPRIMDHHASLRNLAIPSCGWPATGDLAKRKLLPGLFHLHVAGLLPRGYGVIGSAQKSFAMTEEQFRAHARDA